MNMLQHTVGRKILMAITGQGMVLFAIVHVLGNSSIFIGPNGINAYAEHLHSLGPLVWVFRLAMLTLLVIPVIYGIQTTLENNAAKPQGYAVKKNLRTGFAAQNMIWTGLVLLAFLVYHLLHFTARVTPGVVQGVDPQGRFDVFGMVVASFQKGGIAFIYVAAMVALFLHLSDVPEAIRPGVAVNRGQVIATSGNTGHSFAPHLHYQLEAGGAAIDPFDSHATERRGLSSSHSSRSQRERGRYRRGDG